MTNPAFFTQLQADIVSASQKAFAEIAAELGGADKIGGFCLATDEGAMTVVPVFTSGEFLEDYFDLSFEWQEWPIEHGADAEFNQICKRVAEAKDEAEDFEAFAQQLIKTMFAAAQQVRPLLLITEPFIFLLGVSDSCEPHDLPDMVRQLNSPSISKQFDLWWSEREEE